MHETTRECLEHQLKELYEKRQSVQIDIDHHTAELTLACDIRDNIEKAIEDFEELLDYGAH